MGLLESLLSAEWVKRQVMESPFEFFVFVLVLASASFAAGYSVGTRRAARVPGEAGAGVVARPLTRWQAARRIAMLPEPTRALLWELYWKGRRTTAELREIEDDAGVLLGGCEEMGLVESEAKVYVGVVWWLAEPCRSALDRQARRHQI